nr:MAG TPA: AAA ATPase [Bacteriophage sp.]
MSSLFIVVTHSPFPFLVYPHKARGFINYGSYIPESVKFFWFLRI